MADAKEFFSEPVYAPGMLPFWNDTLLAFYRGLRLMPPLRLLDVGCGAGLLVTRACEDGLEAFGVEPYWPGSSERVRRGFAESLPFADGEFDVITCFSVLEYVADARTALAEMARVLRPGGKAHIAVPEFTGYPFLRSGGMHHRTSEAWLRGLLGPVWRIESTESFGIKFAVPVLKRLRLASALASFYWRRYPRWLSDMSVVHLVRLEPDAPRSR